MDPLRRFLGMTLAGLTLCLLDVSVHAGSAKAAPVVEDYSRIPGTELVKRLTKDDTRLAAFRELARRGGQDAPELIDSAEVILCPQGGAKGLLYLVLSGSTGAGGDDGAHEFGYSVPNPKELFASIRPQPLPEKPMPRHERFERLNDLVIHVFNDIGSEVKPFGGCNLLGYGIIADINGDGLAERADQRNDFLENGPEAMVLQVSTVTEKPKLLLAVLYNWGDKKDWDYQFVDRDGDGLAEIEFGPVLAQGSLKAKVVFHWDRDRGRYESPQGESGEHFRVLHGGDEWGDFQKELQTLRQEVPAFLVDPDAKGEAPDANVFDVGFGMDEDEYGLGQGRPPRPRPYSYSSLKRLSNEQIVVYMARGKTEYDFERETTVADHLPENFRKLDAKQAALKLADENRSWGHRRRFRIAVDDRGEVHPPDVCTISYSNRSSGCYYASDNKYLLRVDPKGSYLAFSRVSGAGVVFYDPAGARFRYDLRCIKLSYEEARWIEGVVWWLGRVRTLEDIGIVGGRFVGSTADGHGDLVIASPGKTEANVSGIVWWGAISSRWFEHYGVEEHVNFADLFFRRGVKEYLGKRWEDQKPGPGLVALADATWGGVSTRDGSKGRAKQPSQEQLARETEAQVKRLIGLFGRDESALAYGILIDAVNAAGDYTLARFSSQLKDMTAQEKVRAAAEFALKKIDAAGKPEVLQGWAQSRDEGWLWALLRLRITDKKRYVAALEWWVKNAKEGRTSGFFYALAEADPKRAKELEADMPPEKKTAAAVSSFLLPADAGDAKERDRRIDLLIQTVLDAGAEWMQRHQAIRHLVPDDDPLKYPDAKIDEALVKLLAPVPEDSLLSETCHALAMRGRVQQFDKVAQALAQSNNANMRDSVLWSLARLAEMGGPVESRKLSAILSAEMARNKRWYQSNVIPIAFAMGLKDLKPDIEGCANLGPEDYENESGYRRHDAQDSTPRIHLARKVVAIWNEEDPVTRAKLLVAYGFEEERNAEGIGERTLRRELEALAKALPASDARKVREFAAWCEKHPERFDYEASARMSRAGLGDFVRKTFAVKK